ncbi:hypothetical protein ACR73I_04825 [Bifidobacterium pseudocatenulatum]|uniref:hypothetical protein n=1 Tax=Bifidobacterium pseudocatenulatum TaxID=28026 RepID=UPI003DA2CA76
MSSAQMTACQLCCGTDQLNRSVPVMQIVAMAVSVPYCSCWCLMLGFAGFGSGRVVFG